LKSEGMKAYHDKVEPYIERDISKIEVGDVTIADGHVLNFQVISPFTGKPMRASQVVSANVRLSVTLLPNYRGTHLSCFIKW